MIIKLYDGSVTEQGSNSDKMSMQDRYETISFRRLVEQFLSAQSQGQGFYDSVMKLGWTIYANRNK